MISMICVDVFHGGVAGLATAGRVLGSSIGWIGFGRKITNFCGLGWV